MASTALPPIHDLLRREFPAASEGAGVTLRGRRLDPQIFFGLVDELPNEPQFFLYNERDQHRQTCSKLLDLLVGALDLSAADGKKDGAEGALSSIESIRCLRDDVRTKQFVLAIKDSIAELERRFPGAGPIDVIDAGCGACPVLAIAAALSSPRVRCTALELNPQSAALARSIIKAFGLTDRIQVLETDATSYAPSSPIHVVVSETMSVALHDEPMVQILYNLKAHLVEGGIMIPEKVTIKATLVPDTIQESTDPTQLAVRYYDNVYQLKRYDFERGDSWSYTAGDSPDRVKPRLRAENYLSTPCKEGFYIGLGTEVQIFKGHRLEAYDSNVTRHRLLNDIAGNAWFITKDELSKVFEEGNDGSSSKGEIQISYLPGNPNNSGATTEPPVRRTYMD